MQNVSDGTLTDAEKEAIKIIENFDGDPLDLIPILEAIGEKHLDLERSSGETKEVQIS